MIPNTEVLWRARSTSIEALLIKAQLRWTGHVLCMEDGRLPKDLLYGELNEGSRHVGGQRKRFKDTLKRSLTVCNIDIDKWEYTAQDRMQWRRSVQGAVNAFENERVATAKEKRIKRKAIPSQQPSAPATINLTCTVCGRVCTARIGLQSHMRTHK